MQSMSWRQYRNGVLVGSMWNIILPRGVLTWIVLIDIAFPFPKQILWFLVVEILIKIVGSSF
jgi:hypothetical protein